MKDLFTNYLVRLLLLAIFISGGSWIYAQQITVQGKITASDEEAGIPGANVVIKGTTNGTISDLNGNYSILANKGDVLVFSYVGYLEEEIIVDGTVPKLDIALVPDLIGMEEVVVIGYGTQKKSDLTGAVATVNNEELGRKTTATLEQSLQGLAAGVSVTNNSGSPGEGAKVRIRGVGSLNDVNPLYVIDGVPVDGPGSTNPADIESISVLKDAAAGAIYGARAANGVIMITTKKGQKGFRLSADAKYGVQSAWKKIDLLNSEEYAKYVNEVNYNRGRRNPAITNDPFNQPFDTDWQKEMFRSAPIQQYNLSFGGGNDLITYNISGGYFNQQGIMISSGYEKYYGRANTALKYKGLNTGFNLAFNHSNKDKEKNTVGGRNQIERMLKITPNIAVHDTSQRGGYAGPGSEHGHDAVNPVGVANLYDDTEKTNGLLGNVYAEYEFISGLKFKMSYGFDWWRQENYFHNPVHEMGASHIVGQARWDTTFANNRYNMWENLLTYQKGFGAHNIEAMIGYTNEFSSYQRKENKYAYTEATDTIAFTDAPTQTWERAIVSYFGRVNYSYAEKYLVQANIRRDASSKFGPNNRWGLFPSVSAGWVLSRESFMEAASFISFLKLRASWGKVGNENIPENYGYESTLNNYQRYTFNGELANGTGPSGFPNANLKWEEVGTSNIGLDLSLFENRINLTAEYYYNKTEDMLIKVTMPESNGTFNFPWQNAGSVKNEGFELMLNHKNNVGKWAYSVTGNLTTINNEVLSTNVAGDPLYGGGSELGNSTIATVGRPIGEYYGYVTDGIYKSEDEIDPTFAPNASVGDIKYVDLNPDGELTAEDRTFIGSPIPKLIYGINATVDYAGFDLSISFQGVYGNKLYRETKLWTEGMFSNFNASADVNDRYRHEAVDITTGSGEDAVTVSYPQNINTDMPWAIRNDPNKNALLFSDRYIEDGSYLRLKDLTIGYSFSENVAGKIKANRFRIYFTAMNLLTFTKYTGFDPEIGGASMNRGIDNGYYPQARSYIGGIQLSF